MALHDYQCTVCGTLLRDQFRTIAEGGEHTAPPCNACLCVGSWILMDWIPQVGAMDAATGGGFEPFVTYDGRNQEVVVDSLQKLRRIERESEILARNKEGQQITFRKWSQNDSNKDVNTHGTVCGEQPSPAAKRKFGSTLKKSAEAPDESYGPGVSDANASALGET